MTNRDIEDVTGLEVRG